MLQIAIATFRLLDWKPMTLGVALAISLLLSSATDRYYYFTSRLPGEPLEGVQDIHTHPTVPRTVRVTLSVGF